MKASRPREFFVGKQRPDITADGPSAFPLKLLTRTHQEDFCPWLSGFIDSEGCFEKKGALARGARKGLLLIKSGISRF